MKSLFPSLFCIISFSILESSLFLPSSSEVSALLKQTDVETIVKLWQTLELELNTPCVLISWLRNWEMYLQFLTQLPDVNRQVLMNFSNRSANIGKQSPKFTSACNLVVSNFNFHSNDLDTLIRNDELQQNYHFLIIEPTANFKSLKLPPQNLQLRNAVLLTTQGTSEFFDLDFAGALRPFEGKNVHFRNRWNLHGNPLIFVVSSGFTHLRKELMKELISQFRESTAPETMLATGMVISKGFNGTLQFSQFNHRVGDEGSQWVKTGRGHLLYWTPINANYSGGMMPSIVTGNGGLAFFTGKAKQMRRQNPLEFLSMAMDPLIWTFKLGCLSVTVAFILTTELVHEAEGGRNAEKFSNIPLRVLSLFASLFRLVAQQNITHRLDRLLQRTKIKLMIGPWLVGLIILNSDLQTRLSSSLTSPGWIIPPKTFDQLRKSSYKINSFGLNTTPLGKIFRDLVFENHSLALSLREKFGRAFQYHDSVSCLARIQTGENVCMGNMLTGFVNAQFSLLTAYGEPLFRVSEDRMISTSRALYLSKKFGHLLKRLNYVVNGYFESGIFQKWFEGESFAKIGRKNARAKLEEGMNTTSQGNKKEEEDDVVSDEKAPLSSIFIVLIGNGLGLIVFGWEVKSMLIKLCRILWRNRVVAWKKYRKCSCVK